MNDNCIEASWEEYDSYMLETQQWFKEEDTRDVSGPEFDPEERL
jgi:hypothetical protein